MGMPVGPWLPVLLVSVVPLSQQSWAGQLQPVAANEPFWASSRDVPGLIAAGQAIYAPSGTIAPPVEPPYTAHGTPGFAAGTSNSSSPGPPVIPALIDAGRASGSSAYVISGGTAPGSGPAVIGGGDS